MINMRVGRKKERQTESRSVERGHYINELYIQLSNYKRNKVVVCDPIERGCMWPILLLFKVYIRVYLKK